MLYETITNVSKDAPFPEQTIQTANGPVLLAAVMPPDEPVNQSKTFTPTSILVEKSPRSGGGALWEEARKNNVPRMTPYFNKSEKIENRLAVSPSRAWNVVPYHGRSINNGCLYIHPAKVRTFWTEQGDFLHWSSKLETLDLVTLSDVPAMEKLTQTRASAESFSGLDLMTEAAESPKAMAYFGQKSLEARSLFRSLFGDMNKETRRAIRSGATIEDLLKSADRNARRIGTRWMEYRYAIMPLFYVFNDVKEMVENRNRLLKVDHATEVHKFENSGIPPLFSGRRLVRIKSGSVTVRSTIATSYAPSGLSSHTSANIQMNVFNTAYQLLRLSWVLDWFINVGDFIIANTSVDLSESRVGCTSVRTKTVEVIYFQDELDTSLKYDWNGQNSCFPSGIHYLEPSKNSSLQILKVVETDSYVRTLFDTSFAGRLAFQTSPFGNWKRAVDAAVLSYRPLKNLLRSIR